MKQEVEAINFTGGAQMYNRLLHTIRLKGNIGQYVQCRRIYRQII